MFYHLSYEKDSIQVICLALKHSHNKMDVTKSNLKSTLPEIEQAIRDCTFMSIDCEFTGLKIPSNSISAFDSPKQYYEKVLKDCKDFLVIQYGVTFFRFDSASDKFKHKSYNFYIFRRPLYKFIEDQRFLCQTTSIDFLTSEDFDFNKMFKEGISYLNNVEEEKCRVKLTETHKKQLDFNFKSSFNNHDNIIPIPKENQEFIDNIIKSLEDFVASEKQELKLPKCNAFLRRLIYQTNTEHFSDKVELETRNVDKDRVMFASKLKTPKEKRDLEEKKYADLITQLEDYIGFSKVMRMIVGSGKLVVGHNMLLDLMHTIDKFLTPLPNNYLDFKHCASSLFSKIVDTKYMASLEPFKEFVSSTVLSQMLESVRKKVTDIPQLEVEEGGLGYNLDDGKEHQAGFDSFLTGYGFIAMWKYLGSQMDLPNSDIFNQTGAKLLKPYLNRVHFMMLTDNQYLNLAGPDLTPSRDHVLYLTFPKEWTTNNIVQLFSPFGHVYVDWINGTSAYVALSKKDQVAVALKTLSQSDTYSIMTFAKRQAMQAGSGNAMFSSPAKRHISGGGPSQTKRCKTDRFERLSEWSIEPTEEQIEEEKTDSTSSKSKTFTECETWN